MVTLTRGALLRGELWQLTTQLHNYASLFDNNCRLLSVSGTLAASIQLLVIAHCHENVYSIYNDEALLAAIPTERSWSGNYVASHFA